MLNRNKVKLSAFIGVAALVVGAAFMSCNGTDTVLVTSQPPTGLQDPIIKLSLSGNATLSIPRNCVANPDLVSIEQRTGSTPPPWIFELKPDGPFLNPDCIATVTVTGLPSGKYIVTLISTTPPQIVLTLPTISGTLTILLEHFSTLEIAEAAPADKDGDGIKDEDDNCPDDANSDQKDSDGDGLGDECDTEIIIIIDSDGDGIADNVDRCPHNPDRFCLRPALRCRRLHEVCHFRWPGPPPHGICMVPGRWTCGPRPIGFTPLPPYVGSPFYGTGLWFLGDGYCPHGTITPNANVEVCNGVDDDCDGEIDELFEDVARDLAPGHGKKNVKPCTVGVGACSNTGHIICDPGDNTAPTICNVTPGAPVAEIPANGIDDDCDGATDE